MKDVKGMEWRKEFDSNYTHYINFLLYAMTFLLIISIFFKEDIFICDYWFIYGISFTK